MQFIDLKAQYGVLEEEIDLNIQKFYSPHNLSIARLCESSRKSLPFLQVGSIVSNVQMAWIRCKLPIWHCRLAQGMRYFARISLLSQ